MVPRRLAAAFQPRRPPTSQDVSHLCAACGSASMIRRLLPDATLGSDRSLPESSRALYFYTGLGLLLGFGFLVIPLRVVFVPFTARSDCRGSRYSDSMTFR
jgi:hypothetical protein